MPSPWSKPAPGWSSYIPASSIAARRSCAKLRRRCARRKNDMRIGAPKEIKNHEYRVALTPAGAHVLAAAGHEVRIEARAGAAVGFDDAAYRAAGAQIVASATEAYATDLVIKVKELQPEEFALTHPGQILFCYQHLAPDPALLAAMLERKVSC